MAEKLTHRYIARFQMEAETPLFVGSGQASLLKDALVQKDNNGFPMINGTSLSGVLRHALENENATLVSGIFGDSKGEKGGTGSLLKVSSAFMILENNQVSEGILENNNQEILSKFDNLPSRQHVRITEKGVSENGGLFDNEVVYKGTRFVFELELKGNATDVVHWQQLIELVKSPTFRIGSGTRNGYGSLKVIGLYNSTFDLQDEKQLMEYINFNPSFNFGLKFETVSQRTTLISKHYHQYTLKLEPDSFFIFSEGFGDEQADNKPLEEEIVVYSENLKMVFKKQTVIPASSIKGAIAHRTAFHYNKLTKQFADNKQGKTGIENEAVAALFGKAGKDVADPQAGNVYLNDFYFDEHQINNDKILNHVAIDRFTGGAMDGALFSEKVSALKADNSFDFDIYVEEIDKIENKETIVKSLENTLEDICKGLLPLGGMTTKGHGMFTGVLLKNGSELFNYKNN
jgi:CRISPR/Cas system CSM-associated protein Csm3 (group 7 of RAMP superfamily)